MFKINGVYCASLTPINNNLTINTDLYLRHCQALMHKGLDGLTLFGTNGEASSFSIRDAISSKVAASSPNSSRRLPIFEETFVLKLPSASDWLARVSTFTGRAIERDNHHEPTNMMMKLIPKRYR